MTTRVARVTAQEELDAAFAIRRAVFVAEQGVPDEAEIDRFEDLSRHFLAFVDDEPVGALRWRWSAPGTAKLERVAVLAATRGAGVGRALVAAALDDIDAHGASVVILHAQLTATRLYARFGFAEEGEPFVEDGILHVVMRRNAGR